MKVFIHKSGDAFTKSWIEYCKENGVNYVLGELFDSNLIQELRKANITHVLFHIGTNDYKTELITKFLPKVIESEGIKVFPDFNTYWHYDDKLKQKYLFEHLNIPHGKMEVFYEKETAKNWIESKADFPFVFKLKKGAGSYNVKLVNNKNEAYKFVSQMFGKGIDPMPSTFNDIRTKVRKHSKKRNWIQVIKRLPSTLKNNFLLRKSVLNERGYFYTQKFYPDNGFDVRVVVVGNKAWSLRRYVRENDFRASGSGNMIYDKNLVDKELLKIAFDSADKMRSQSIAFDFIYDSDKKPKIIECSYCWPSGPFLEDCEGYWDKGLNHFNEFRSAEKEIIINLLKNS